MTMTHAPEPQRRLLRPRWLYGLCGLLVSVLDIALAMALDTELSLDGRDITGFIWLYLALSFGTLGFLIGVLLEQRQRARVAEREIADQMARLGALQARLAQAEKLSTLGQLAATIAHEIRNPLAVIRSSVQNVAEVAPDADDDVRDSCRFALDEIDRLNRVTTSMLDFARPLRPRRKRVEVTEVFERVQLLASPLLADKQLQLTTAPARSIAAREPATDAGPGEPLTAELDIDLVCQALIGLIANAVQVSERGQAVALEAKRADDDHLTFTVADRGPGIPDDVHDKLFEPFFTTGKRGNGLGLAVVRDIARAHAGDIAVANRADGGARFTLTLPMIAL